MPAENRPLRATLVTAVLAAAVAWGAAAAGTSKPTLYRASQATAGALPYAANCSACHGQRLEGGAGPPLSGSALAVRARSERLTVGDMFSFLAQQMPLNEPGTLRRDEYVDIMAFILRANGYPAGRTALTYSAAMKSRVRIASRP